MPIKRLSKLLTFSTFILIVAGGLVTSTDSGLAVPDWPLSYGTLFPQMVGGIRFEHTHRLIAGFILFLTILLVGVSFREKKRTAIILSLIALTLVLLQALLGGLTVLYKLPKPISISHACLGQTFFTLVASIAWIYSDTWKKSEPHKTPLAGLYQFLSVLVFTNIYIQLILGAIVRHVGGHWVWLHILNAILVLILSISLMGTAIYKLKQHKPTLISAVHLCGFIIIQFLLGLGAFVFTFLEQSSRYNRPISEVYVTTAHQSLGAIILALACIMTLNAFRFLTPKNV